MNVCGASKPVAMPASCSEGSSKASGKQKLRVADDGRKYTLWLPCPIRAGNLERYDRVVKHCTRNHGFLSIVRLKYVAPSSPLGVFLGDRIAKQGFAVNILGGIIPVATGAWTASPTFRDGNATPRI